MRPTKQDLEALFESIGIESTDGLDQVDEEERVDLRAVARKLGYFYRTLVREELPVPLAASLVKQYNEGLVRASFTQVDEDFAFFFDEDEED